MRDLFGWFGDTIDAKDQRDDAIKERDTYRAQVASMQQRLAQAEQRAKINKVDAEGMGKYGPVDANVFVRSPSSWYQQVTINKGLDDGIRRGDPAINGAGLVGKVADATGGSAGGDADRRPELRHERHTSARPLPGSITPADRRPRGSAYEPVDATAKVRENDLIYTAGTTDTRPLRATRRPSWSAR